MENSTAAAAKSLQSCPTLCNPIHGSPPGSPVPGILQARALEWVAISFSNACKWKVKVKLLSPVWLLATPWTAAYQAPPSMGFSRQEYWSGVPWPSPENSIEVPQKTKSRTIIWPSNITTGHTPRENLNSKRYVLLEKCKSKLQWDITPHWSEWPSSKSLQTVSAGEDVGKRERSCTGGGNINWYSHYGRWYGDSFKN